MLLHEKTQLDRSVVSKYSTTEVDPIVVHESKLGFTLQANLQEWELDINYFKSMYEQLLSLATKGNMKNDHIHNDLKSLLFKMDALINEDTIDLIDRMNLLVFEFKNSEVPKLGTIFRDYADLEEEFQLLRNDFRKLTVRTLKEINRVCPVKIY